MGFWSWGLALNYVQRIRSKPIYWEVDDNLETFVARGSVLTRFTGVL